MCKLSDTEELFFWRIFNLKVSDHFPESGTQHENEI